MHGTIHVYIDAMHPCMCNNSSMYLELHTFANGTIHVCTWKYTYVLTMLMRVRRNKQLKTTASKQINKIEHTSTMDAGVTFPIKCLCKEQRVLTHFTTWMTLKKV